MRRLTVSGPARSDLLNIREYTTDRYGHATAHYYNTLLSQAIQDIRENPYRLGSKHLPEIGKSIYSYHIALSRNRVERTIKKPRHLIFYFLPDEDKVIVVRVLHDSRDFTLHISEEYTTK